MRLAVDAGHEVVATIRDPAQADELRRAGAEPVVVDVTGDVAAQLGDAADSLDVIIYAIGAGAGSGAEKKGTVDRDGSDKLVALAQERGIRRYLMVSSDRADDPMQANGDFRAYLQAKADADATVAATDLDWTILRPGALSDERGTGEVTLGSEPGMAGPVTRDDVAAVLLELLDSGALVGATVELAGGGRPVPEAVRTLAG